MIFGSRRHVAESLFKHRLNLEKYSQIGTGRSPTEWSPGSTKRDDRSTGESTRREGAVIKKMALLGPFDSVTKSGSLVLIN